MAHVDTGGGGKRAVSEELNLVPFIDLMSVLITFLLITAVWTQVSMIQIGSSIYGKKTDDEKVDIPPNADIVLKLEVHEYGYRLVMSKQTVTVQKVENEYDDVGLLAQLKRFKEIYPEKKDATIFVADELPYGVLIRGMDNLLIAGFPQIGIATGAP